MSAIGQGLEVGQGWVMEIGPGLEIGRGSAIGQGLEIGRELAIALEAAETDSRMLATVAIASTIDTTIGRTFITTGTTATGVDIGATAPGPGMNILGPLGASPQRQSV